MTTRQSNVETGEIEGRGGVQLHYVWNPSPEAPRGALVVVHGFAEHAGRYDHVARFLNERAFDVMRFDCRGCGQSQGRRSYVDSYRDFVDDLDLVTRRTILLGGEQPLFLLGHSQGGLIVAAYALQNPEGIDGLVLSSPALRFAVDVPLVKRLAGQLMSALWPTFGMAAGIDPAVLSHDRTVGEAYAADPLVSRAATARWYVESLRTQATVLESARRIGLPTLVLQAGDDRLVDPATSRAFYLSLGTTDKRWLLYEGFYHELFNEVDRDQVFSDLGRWLGEHV